MDRYEAEFMVTDADDALLVERAKAGDREAFGSLVKKYRIYVFAVAFRIAGDPHDAEDLSQDAFVKAFTKIESFRKEASFKSWVGRIAANLAINYIKRRQRMVFAEDERGAALDQAPAGPRYSPSNDLARREMAERIENAIADLPAEDQAVFKLAVIDGRAHRDIADIMDCAEGTVAWRLHRARKRLIEAMDPGREGRERAKQ